MHGRSPNALECPRAGENIARVNILEKQEKPVERILGLSMGIWEKLGIITGLK